MYFTIFQYGEYDSHNQLFKFIFKQTPVKSSRRQNSNFIWCNKGSFHKFFFFLFKRVLNLFDAC